MAERIGLQPGARVLDLGCGAASTSIFLAKEFGVEVWAADLWIDPDDNRRRIEAATMSANIHPLRAEAHRLPFDRDFFDAVVCIDAYHYFGTEIRYLSYLAGFVRPGGIIAVVMPGNEIDPDDAEADRLEPGLAAEFGADWFTFRSAEWWARHWAHTRCVDVEHIGMIPDGRDDWDRWIAASLAAYGPHPGVGLNARMIDDPAARSLGFCFAMARRNGNPGIDFG